jgi:hypothetical protein
MHRHRLSRAALPYLVIALIAVGGVVMGLSAHTARLVLFAAVAAGAGAVVVSWLRWEAERDSLDRWIADRAGSPPPPELVEQRTIELVGPVTRRQVSRSLRSILEDSRRPPRPTARIPSNRVAVNVHRAELHRIADTLDDVERPITPRFAAQARLLVTSGGSPVYGGGARRRRKPAEALARLRFELEER